jgi:hypothetical protein
MSRQDAAGMRELLSKRTRYLWFREVAKPGRKTRFVGVVSISSGDVLGVIEWYGAWRQYIFEAAPDTVWNIDCLREVETVLSELNADD